MYAVLNMDYMESTNVSLKVSFKKMCLKCCFEDTDCYAGSDIVWKCIPDTVNDRIAPHEFL